MQDAHFCKTPENSNSNLTEATFIVSELSDEAKLKMEVIQSLLSAGDRTTYTQRLKEAAEKLGKSVRTVRRLIEKWELEGLVGLVQARRADKGKHRVDENWQEFILKTYNEGNKGSKRITRLSVAVRVKARADELGVKPPSHMTVYRVLKPLIDQEEKVKSIRSPGWRGSRLSVKTRDGKDLLVEYSNQVWQCDRPTGASKVKSHSFKSTKKVQVPLNLFMENEKYVFRVECSKKYYVLITGSPKFIYGVLTFDF